MKSQQPAFPSPMIISKGDKGTTFSPSLYMGITKREYYAAKAMQGMMADPKTSNNAMLIAHDAFRVADAMIEFEEKEGKE